MIYNDAYLVLTMFPHFVFFLIFGYVFARRGEPLKVILRDGSFILFVSIVVALVKYFFISQSALFDAGTLFSILIMLPISLIPYYAALFLGISVYKLKMKAVVDRNNPDFFSLKSIFLLSLKPTLILSIFVFLLDAYVLWNGFEVGPLLSLSFVLLNPISMIDLDIFRDLIVRFPITILYLFVFIFLVTLLYKRSKRSGLSRVRKGLFYVGIVAVVLLYLLQSFLFLYIMALGGI
jgi:hypothetical protein